MVGDNPVSAVLISADLDACRDFYENKLGLELSPRTIKNHLLFECGDGTTLLIYFRPGDNNADHTQVRCWTQDIEADVAELEGRGVVVEEYDTEYIKTVDHIATTPGIGPSVRFKDPAGNTMALFQPE